MGLDITAYEQIVRIDCLFDEDGEPVNKTSGDPLDEDEYVQLYVNHNFPDRALDIVHKGIYSFASSLGVSCGAYSAYNAFRDDLAKAAGWPLGSYEKYGETWTGYQISACTATSGVL